MKKYIAFINSNDVRRHLESIGWEPDALCAAWLVYKSKSSTLGEKIEAWESIIATADDVQLDGYPYTLKEFLHRYIEAIKQYASDFVRNENRAAVYSYSLYVRDEEWIKDERIFSSYAKVSEAMKEDVDIDGIVRFSVCKRLIDVDMDGEFLNLTPDFRVIDINYSSYLLSDELYVLFYEIFSDMTFDVPTPDFKGKSVTEVNGKYYPAAYYDQTFIYDHHTVTPMFAYGHLVDEPEQMECYAENYLDLEFTE